MKKSCLRMWSRLGLSSGVLASRLAISCLACAEREEGREYRASLMHRYVSFKLVVSNGGRPSSMVYLEARRQQAFRGILHSPFQPRGSRQLICL